MAWTELSEGRVRHRAAHSGRNFNDEETSSLQIGSTKDGGEVQLWFETASTEVYLTIKKEDFTPTIQAMLRAVGA